MYDGNTDEAPTTPTAAGTPKHESARAYLTRHRVHVVVDNLVQDILTEKPHDPGVWMQRWLLEHHRQQCAQRHSMSPLANKRAPSPPQDAADVAPPGTADAEAAQPPAAV